MKKEYPKHEYSDNCQTQNKYGEWVPAICEPYWTGFLLRKAQCWACKDRPTFKNREEYYGHYALRHILGMP